MDDRAKMFRCAAVCGSTRLGVVLHQYLRTVTLPLRHHAHVESRVEQLTRRNLRRCPLTSDLLTGRQLEFEHRIPKDDPPALGPTKNGAYRLLACLSRDLLRPA